MSIERIFIVDDDPSIRDGAAMALESSYAVQSFASAEEALRAKETPDLLLLDVGLPGMDGIEALRRFKNRHPHVPAIIITAYEDVETVVSAIRLGAYDYVVKPLHMDALETRIKNALQGVRRLKEVQRLQEKSLKENMPCFVGESESMTDVMEVVGLVAGSPDTPVMICGETGTGKDLIAAAIHYRSPNCDGPLVKINCAAIPADLLESELFGYEPGAFSGARDAGKRGVVEEAAGGTLFLDEVGDLSPEAQAKLLRFLESGEFYKVGGTKPRRVKTRTVSATNKDLEAMIAAGAYRKDLYFRLGVIRIMVPSLNERASDVLPLAEHFLSEFSLKFDKEFNGFTREAQEALTAHDWRGNIRELRNAVERAAILESSREITPRSLGLLEIPECDLPSASGQTPPLDPSGVVIDEILEKVERRYFEQALALAAGNRNEAARLLGLNHHTLRYRLKKLGLN